MALANIWFIFGTSGHLAEDLLSQRISPLNHQQ